MKKKNKHISRIISALLICSYLSPIICLALPNKIDSLKSLLSNPVSDTTRLRLCFETGYAEYYDYNYDSAIAYYSKALEYSGELKDKAFQAKVHFSFGELYLERGNFDLALEHYFSATDIYVERDNQEALIDCYFGAGLAYKSKGYYNVALTYYNLSLNLSELANNPISIADNFNNIGTVEKNQGNYPESMVHLSKALEIYQNNNMPVRIFNVLNNIGSLHEKQGSLQKALEYYQQSLQLARETGNKYYLFAPLANSASMYSILGEYEKSTELFNEAIDLANEINDNVRIADCYIELGSLMRKKGKLESAFEYYSKALKIAEENENNSTKSIALINIAKLSFEKGNYNKALEDASKALAISKKINALPLIVQSNQMLYEIFNEKGDFETALNYRNNWVAMKDSLFSIEKAKTIDELEIQYQVKTKIDENNRLLSEAETMQQILNQRKKLSILLSLGILLTLGIIFLLIKQGKNRKQIQLQEKAIDRQKMENLNNKVEYQKRELVSKSIYIAERNNVLERIIRQLEELVREEDAYKISKIKSIVRELKFELRHKKHWKEFETHFNAVHPEFYQKLNSSFPGLTVNDRKLSAFLKLKLTTKDISGITGQSTKSIEVARTRLRKKLNMEHEDNLYDVIEQI